LSPNLYLILTEFPDSSKFSCTLFSDYHWRLS